MGMLLPLASGLLSLSRPVAPSLHRAGSRFIRAARAVGGERLTALSCYSWPQELGSELTKKFFSISDGYRPEISSACDGVQGREFIDATIRYALPGDYLRKVDISSAAHGLEVRVPFLGNQVLECSSRINVEHKYNWKERKIILRRLAEQYLPESVTQRPKSGFGIPLDQWLTHEDKSSLRDALTSSSAAIRDIISPEYTALIMSSFVDGNRDKSKFSRFMVYQRAFILWSLERWLQRWRPSL
jgi:asparagine synthase (glutamine-hydrolysing)